jgi:hypothetical protein
MIMNQLTLEILTNEKISQMMSLFIYDEIEIFKDFALMKSISYSSKQ